jgi:hypothetical protein
MPALHRSSLLNLRPGCTWVACRCPLGAVTRAAALALLEFVVHPSSNSNCHLLATAGDSKPSVKLLGKFMPACGDVTTLASG